MLTCPALLAAFGSRSWRRRWSSVPAAELPARCSVLFPAPPAQLSASVSHRAWWRRQPLEARPGFIFHKQLTPQEMGTDPLRKMGTPLRPSLCGVRGWTAGEQDERCQSGVCQSPRGPESSSILWSLGFPVTVCPFYRSPESIRPALYTLLETHVTKQFTNNQ